MQCKVCTIIRYFCPGSLMQMRVCMSPHRLSFLFPVYTDIAAVWIHPLFSPNTKSPPIPLPAPVSRATEPISFRRRSSCSFCWSLWALAYRWGKCPHVKLGDPRLMRWLRGASACLQLCWTIPSVDPTWQERTEVCKLPSDLHMYFPTQINLKNCNTF